MGESAFALINAILFAITVAITPTKQSGARIVVQVGVQAGQPVSASAPVATEIKTDHVDN